MKKIDISNRLISAIEILLNHIYKDHGDLVYIERGPVTEALLSEIDIDLNIAPGQDGVIRIHGGPDDESYPNILAVTVPHEIDLSNTLMILFNKSNSGVEEDDWLLIYDYDEDTDVIDNILNSTPEELELYLKLL